MTTEYYTVGDWQNGKAKCPIKKAGLDGSEWANELAESFDGEARTRYEIQCEVTQITEEEAREAWNSMLKRLANAVEQNKYDDVADHKLAMVGLAEEVQSELNWE